MLDEDDSDDLALVVPPDEFADDGEAAEAWRRAYTWTTSCLELGEDPDEDEVL